MKKPFMVSIMMGLLMVSSAALTMILKPSVDLADQQNQIDLENMIPRDFDDWKIDPTAVSFIIDPEVKAGISKLYSQTLSRVYINNLGERVMLSIAYGRDQRTDLQVHRPEVCYLSSGFDVGKLTKTFVDTTIARIPVMHLVAKKQTRIEPITYWIRMGDSITRGWFEQKAATLNYELSGKVPDGLLFRVSTISNDEQDSYKIQQTFIMSLLQAVQSKDRHWLIGQLAQS
ncbi:MAG: exosortase-associated protein EpsI, B-type [Gallionella sp.]|jgi:EpsI family protein